MSEPTPEPVEPEPDSQPSKTFPYSKEKKRKVGLKNKMALLEIIERKRLTERVDYKAIAIRHHTTPESLRQLYYQWRRGHIDLGDPETPEEKRIDARMQHEHTLELLKRYKGLVLKGFEGALLEAEDRFTHGETESWKQVSPILKELKFVSEIQSLHEKGYASILEEMMSLRQSEKQLQLADKTIDVPTETKVIHANDEERAMAALAS